ncbi:carboxypeptidase-like regulatory domain-containing protein [Streptomyces albulus]|nr:carboxypeptidase-like regulatory domain-containing protein [Streptomyces noursei]
MRLALVPTGSRLRGTLRGGPDGAALTGAGVVVTDGRGDVVTCTSTDADGHWEVGQLPDGDYTLVLSAAGHQPEARAVQLTGGDGTDSRSGRAARTCGCGLPPRCAVPSAAPTDGRWRMPP